MTSASWWGAPSGGGLRLDSCLRHFSDTIGAVFIAILVLFLVVSWALITLGNRLERHVPWPRGSLPLDPGLQPLSKSITIDERKVQEWQKLYCFTTRRG